MSLKRLAYLSLGIFENLEQGISFMNGFVKTPLFVISLTLAMTGCKIEVIVPSGGDVVSSNADHNCSAGSVCEFDITAEQLPFIETFYAHPRPGYEFEKWSDGESFQCAKSTNPACTITLADNAIGAMAVALFDSGYLMPIFRDVGIDTDEDGVRNKLDEDDDGDGIPDIEDACPLNPDLSCSPHTITVNGKTWYQPDLFLGLTRAEIDAACSDGVCEGGLNGYDVTGWTWASSQDVIGLLNYYGTMNLDEICPATYSFFLDGWRETNSTFIYTLRIAGWTQDSAVYAAPQIEPCQYNVIPISTSGSEPFGAFFYVSAP